MTDKELRELAERATPGKWTWIIRGNSVQSHAIVCHNDPVSLNPQNICSGISPKTGNAAYISAANPARIIELLNRVEKLEKMVDRSCELLSTNCITVYRPERVLIYYTDEEWRKYLEEAD